MDKKLVEVLSNFKINGNVLSVEPYGDGHINRTYLAVYDNGKRYILQKMNNKVFADIDSLMNNIVYVTSHLKSKGIGTLDVVSTKDEKSYLTIDGEHYRVYDFIEDTISYNKVDDAKIFYNAGKAFGEFQSYLASFDATKLVETIPNFHNTTKRFESFIESLNSNLSGRKDNALEEIKFVLDRKDTYSKIVDGLKDGSIPLRVTHNDTKLNNIMMDAQSGECRAIIDLDTIMPGSMLYDFGDSIRFGASSALEDEKDLNKVHFVKELFTAYAEGFCNAVKSSITEKEAELLAYSAYLMTMECGMRFLKDYVDGDTYFATKYDEHNLIRCRTQFKLAKEIEEQMEELNTIVKDILTR